MSLLWLAGGQVNEVTYDRRGRVPAKGKQRLTAFGMSQFSLPTGVIYNEKRPHSAFCDATSAEFHRSEYAMNKERSIEGKPNGPWSSARPRNTSVPVARSLTTVLRSEPASRDFPRLPHPLGNRACRADGTAPAYGKICFL